MNQNGPLCGWVDLQVNGYLGVDYSSETLTESEFCSSADQLIQQGVDLFLPTIITSSERTYRRNLPLVARILRESRLRDPVPGIHLEGPFLSSKPGAVGAHNPDWIQTPDLAALDRLQELAQGTVRLLTVAADAPGVLELIRHAVSMGITVSLGHHLATEKQIFDAAEAGARMLTHLGNGVPNLLPRHENPIWAGLACDALTAMIIPDGHHLPESIVKIILRVKGADRVIAVSDQSSIAGLPPGRYRALGNDVVLEPSGRLHNPEKQCLVGSALTLPSCMKWLEAATWLGNEDRRKLGRLNALRMLGIQS